MGLNDYRFDAIFEEANSIWETEVEKECYRDGVTNQTVNNISWGDGLPRSVWDCCYRSMGFSSAKVSLEKLGTRLAPNLEELLKESDFVVIHLSLADEA